MFAHAIDDARPSRDKSEAAAILARAITGGSMRHPATVYLDALGMMEDGLIMENVLEHLRELAGDCGLAVDDETMPRTEIGSRITRVVSFRRSIV